MSGLPLAVPVGDPGGVGPEVSLRALDAAPPDLAAVLFGDARQLSALARAQGVRRPLVALDGSGGLPKGALGVVDTGAVSEAAVARHAPCEETGRAQWETLRRATDWVLEGRARALVTAPVSKEAITRAGHAFTGQTEYLAQRAGLSDDAVTMMFLGPRLRVALVTTHLAVRDVPDAITPHAVDRAIRHLADALGRLSGGRRPTLVVSGLNPHAGEGGLFGDEDARVLAPAIARAQATWGESCCVEGPTPAEAAFRAAQAGRVDGVVAMFHDQATIASKLLDWGSAVNVTWGLPFVRTSVDHGVAYDAARDGTASDEGMRAAVSLADRLTSGAR